MADFSLVLDQDQVVHGIWLKNPSEANDIFFMTMLSARIANEGAKFPEEYQAAILAKQYRIVPNTQNASGGVFIMFGDYLAPGEKEVTTEVLKQYEIVREEWLDNLGVAEVLDQNKIVQGVWIANPEDAKDISFLNAVATRLVMANFPYSIRDVLSINYRIIPNNFNNAGGCFVMFGNSLAPGEQKGTTIDKPKKNETEHKITHFLCPVDRHSVETLSEDEITFIKNYIKNIATASIAKTSLDLFTLTISGYDNDPRELYEIPEVCKWARNAFQKIPYLIYFLDDASTKRFVAWLIGPISKLEAFSKAFERKFFNKLSKVMDSSSSAATDYIDKLSGTDMHVWFLDQVINKETRIGISHFRKKRGFKILLFVGLVILTVIIYLLLVKNS